MICFPLNNMAYEANALGAWLGTRTRGVYSADDNLAVLADGEGMHITLRPGLAWLKRDTFWGAVILQEEVMQLQLEPADGVLSRIDTIVLRLDKDDNLAKPLVRTGTFAATPNFLPPVRDAHADEIFLASVLVGPGAVAVTQADVTDLRLNEAYCGLMRDGVTGIPTQTLHAQWAAFLSKTQQDTLAWQQAAEEAFDAWLHRMQELFAEDPAGGLQTQLDTLTALTQQALEGKAAAVHTHTKDEVGLASVDNTADSEKSVLYAQTAGAAVDQTARNAAAGAQAAANTAQTAANARMPIAGGTFTGNVAAYGTNRTNNCLRNIYVNGVSTNYILMVRK